MARWPTIDELSRDELIVIVREQQQQIAALAKLIGKPPIPTILLGPRNHYPPAPCLAAARSLSPVGNATFQGNNSAIPCTR